MDSSGQRDLSTTARRLRDLVEPLAAGVYFAPEALERYEALGLSYLPGYFCSRSGCMGKVAPPVVTAAFGVFNPRIVEPAVAEGWEKTDPEPLLDARLAGAVEQLQRLVGDPDGDVKQATEILRGLTERLSTSGRPLFAGLTSLSWPDDGGWGDLWRAADLVREHRGDAHTAAWVRHVKPVEITLLTEGWWGIPLGSYVTTRGYGEDAIEEGKAALRERGLLDGDELTAGGVALREEIETETDEAERDVVERLGNAAEKLFALLEPWSKAVVAGGGYPVDPANLTRYPS